MKEPRSRASARIGQLVRDLRHQSTISRKKLADRADMDVSHLARIEAGQGNPTIHTILQLATALDVEPEVFVRGLTADDLPEGVRPYSEAEILRELRRRDGGTSRSA
ncbi:helix-turn-helix domain-containing protein [Microbacterium sp. SLBN-146]|uniref:helix-turn-helix domain-containing protein n=1 Tax=Microbacterium sp. SLBN-146 TaxID=2768457 RepID=UPI0011664479|nr:helix-turn-helix transcriptional regulator [Microbacterium sp. SLBN-146]TQJ31796.1 helix-turn-helix protein [Microbacterium sp. SLBN-146]